MHTFKVTEDSYHGHLYWQHCFKHFCWVQVSWIDHASSAVTIHCKLCCPCLTVYQMCNGVSCVCEVLWHPQCTDLSAVPLFRQCCAHYPAKHLTLEQSHLTVKNISWHTLSSIAVDLSSLQLINMCPATEGTSLQNCSPWSTYQLKYSFYVICEILWHTEWTHFSAIQLRVDKTAHWTEKCLCCEQH
jgi:hypothetical protein